MTVTSNTIANQAVQLMGGNQPAVSGMAPTFDSSTNGKALQNLYAPTVAAVARQYEWGFARTVNALVVTGNAAPFPWAYEYSYPAQCVQIWQLAPAALADPNDPLPINWIDGSNLVGGTQSRVIWTNQANAQAIFNANPAESTWDALFRQAVVELLARVLSLATAGKPDLAQSLLESSSGFTQIAEGRDG